MLMIFNLKDIENISMKNTHPATILNQYPNIEIYSPRNAGNNLNSIVLLLEKYVERKSWQCPSCVLIRLGTVSP